MWSSKQRKQLVESLELAGVIKSSDVKEAMLRVKRENFVLQDYKSIAYVDKPLPIPGEQTISAPHMHAICLEQLKLGKKDKFLEVGAGSGIFLAYAYEMIKRRKRVFGIEVVQETYEFAKQNLKKAGYLDKVELLLGDGTLGLPECAPFTKILVSAAAPGFPPPLVKQLEERGIILGMIGRPLGKQYLVKGVKSKDKLKTESLLPVAFVKLTGKYGWKV